MIQEENLKTAGVAREEVPQTEVDKAATDIDAEESSAASLKRESIETEGDRAIQGNEKPAPAKTYEEHVLRELDEARERADTYESILATLQRIFIVKYNAEDSSVSIELDKDSIDPKKPEVARQTMGLLIGLFGKPIAKEDKNIAEDANNAGKGSNEPVEGK